MGTDIHGGFIKITGGMQDEGVLTKEAIKSSWSMDRDYTLFAILAGVRNGHGFAGCYRHEPLEPISEGKGFPDWLTVNEEECPELHNKWYGSTYSYPNDNEYGEWMGDHSYTYMSLDEILSWSGWEKKLSRGGIVDLGHYKYCLENSINPESWCGGVSGGDVLIIEEDEFLVKQLVGTLDKVTHVKATWSDTETLGEQYSWFLDMIKKLKDDNHDGEVYLCIGFDS